MRHFDKSNLLQGTLFLHRGIRVAGMEIADRHRAERRREEGRQSDIWREKSFPVGFVPSCWGAEIAKQGSPCRDLRDWADGLDSGGFIRTIGDGYKLMLMILFVFIHSDLTRGHSCERPKFV